MRMRWHPLWQDQVMELYSRWYTVGDIAEIVGMSSRAVDCYIARAKSLGDPRVNRPVRSVREVEAYVRSKQIEALASKGYSPRSIARRIGVDISLVYRRMKQPIQLEAA